MSLHIDPMSQYSVEELVAELQRRGLLVTLSTSGSDHQSHSGYGAASTVFEVLEAMEAWTKIDRHRNDKDRTINEVWTYFYKCDWARSPKGYSVDANKSIRVGLGEYSKHEVTERMIDTY